MDTQDITSCSLAFEMFESFIEFFGTLLGLE